MTIGSESICNLFMDILFLEDRDYYTGIIGRYIDERYDRIFEQHPEYNNDRLCVTDFSSLGFPVTQEEYNDFIIIILDRLVADYNSGVNTSTDLISCYMTLPFLYTKTLGRYIDFSDKKLNLSNNPFLQNSTFLTNVEVTEDFLLSLPNNFGGIDCYRLLSGRIYSESFLIKFMDKVLSSSFGGVDFGSLLGELPRQRNISDTFIERYAKYFDQYDFWCREFGSFSPSEDFILNNLDKISRDMLNCSIVRVPSGPSSENPCTITLRCNFSDNFFCKVCDKLDTDVIIAFIKSGCISQDVIREKCSNLPSFVWEKVYEKDS